MTALRVECCRRDSARRGLAAGVPVPGQRRSDASGWCSAWAVGRGPSGLGAGPLVRCSRQTEESGDLSPWRRGPVGLDGVGVLPRRGLDCLQCWLRTVGGMRACGHNACRGRWLSRVTHWTRLETRTKECSTRASLWPEWPPGAVRAKVCSLRTEARAPCRVAGPIADRSHARRAGIRVRARVLRPERW